MNDNNIKWYSAIRMKVAIVVIIVCTVVLGGLSAYNTLNEQKALTAELDTLARVTAERLSKHLIGPMWDLDRELVDATLEAEMLEQNIEAIVVWDSETKSIFSARERDALGRVKESAGSITGDVIKGAQKVSSGDKVIGDIAVFVSKKQLNLQLAQTTQSAIITLIALIVTMSIVMTIVIGQLIVRPLTKLAKHADDISHGDLEQTIDTSSNDEIGQLAEAFHRMQTSLRVAFKRIESKS